MCYIIYVNNKSLQTKKIILRGIKIMENKKTVIEEARKIEALNEEIMKRVDEALDDAICEIETENGCDFYEDKKDYIDSSEYICDAITEFADDKVDIYTYDLLEWLQENYDIVEDANNELGIPSSDILDQVRQGQYYKAQQDLYNDSDEIIKALIFFELKDQLSYKIDELALTMEDLEKIIDEIEYQREINYIIEE